MLKAGGGAEEGIFYYCHQRLYEGKTETGDSEPTPATDQGICKPCLFFWLWENRLGCLCLVCLALIFWARGPSNGMVIDIFPRHGLFFFVDFMHWQPLCPYPNPRIRRWSFSINKTLLLYVAFTHINSSPSRQTCHSLVIEHHACTYFLPVDTSTMCWPHVFTAGLSVLWLNSFSWVLLSCRRSLVGLRRRSELLLQLLHLQLHLQWFSLTLILNLLFPNM